jgi:hypothetical protein
MTKYFIEVMTAAVYWFSSAVSGIQLRKKSETVTNLKTSGYGQLKSNDHTQHGARASTNCKAATKRATYEVRDKAPATAANMSATCPADRVCSEEGKLQDKAQLCNNSCSR